MSWMTRLYETYESNESQIGLRSDDEKAVLLPIAHIESSSHIEIIIDRDGNLITARLLSSDEPKIIIPCSEASAGRAGSKPENHPLSDKLQYLAGDYQRYGGSKWFAYNEFKDSLLRWTESEFTNDKIKAVYRYINKGTLIEDMVNKSILTLDKDGKLEAKWDKEKFPNAPKISQEDAIVRWRVEISNDMESRLWMDNEVFKSWIDYNFSNMREQGYCNVLNEEVSLISNHPKNIYSRCANAKLISSNDDKGFTFRGRFDKASQAHGVSYEVSQKAHNALKWLINKQGYAEDRKVILTWGVKNTEVPSGQESSSDFLGLGLIEAMDAEGYTGEQMAQALKNKIRGYKSKIDKDDKIIIMNLESATDGRFSIIYYQELMPDEFIDRLEKWHTTCMWEFEYKNRKYIGAPAPMEIAKAIYGDSDSLDIKAKLRVVDRLLSCIVDQYKIPIDIVNSTINKTIRRISYDSDIHDSKKRHEFNKMLSISCALFNKYSKDYKKGEYNVALEKDRRTRDYLYGRLLAVAQSIESYALYETGESRMTNADRLMHRFSEHPFSTWKTIELSLKPYIERLGSKVISKTKILDEIMCLFEAEDFIKDTKLSGEFLLGYHCQRQDFFKSKDSNVNELNETI